MIYGPYSMEIWNCIKQIRTSIKFMKSDNPRQYGKGIVKEEQLLKRFIEGEFK